MIAAGQRDKILLKLPRVTSIYFCQDKMSWGEKRAVGATTGRLPPNKKWIVTIITLKQWITEVAKKKLRCG